MKNPARRGPRQTELRLPTWGGKRKGAGRKPNGARAGVSHLCRPAITRRLPIHVTVKMAEHVYNLRSQRSFRVIERALLEAADRFDVQVLKFSVQGNHIHLLVESKDKAELAHAIQGFSVRIAHGMNQMMGKRGRVFADRYHSRVLRTPTEVKRAIHYLRDNFRHHVKDTWMGSAWVDPYSSESAELTILLPLPRSWLLREGWRRGKS